MLISFLDTLLTAVLSMMVLMTGWLAVQRLWRRFFPERAGKDGDALSSGGCNGCNCSGSANEILQCGQDSIAPDQLTTEVTHYAP